MSVRMVSADMDGTLLDNEKRITDRTLQAIREVMKKGTLFVLNSGRMLQSVTPYADQIGVNAPMICYNGALTWDGKSDKKIDSTCLCAKTAQDILRYTEKAGYYVQAFWGTEFYCTQYTEKTRFYEEKANVKGIVTGKPLAPQVTEDVNKLLIILDPGQMDTVLPVYESMFGDRASLVPSSRTFLEIVDKEASKGNALMRLAAILGIAPEEVMAFGDETNDLSMLTASGYGYAMDNASDAVKAQVRFIAPSNEEEGLAQVLEQGLRDGIFAGPVL